MPGGAFRCSSCAPERFAEELARIAPAECVLPESFDRDAPEALVEVMAAVTSALQREEIPVSSRPGWTFDAPRGRRAICEQLKVGTLEAFGVEEQPEVLAACGALLDYLKDTQNQLVRVNQAVADSLATEVDRINGTARTLLRAPILSGLTDNRFAHYRSEPLTQSVTL